MIPSEVADRVMKLKSSVCMLLIADLVQRGQVDGDADFGLWISNANDLGLKSGMWMGLYELTRKGWWPSKVSSDFVAKHDYFGDLLADKVYFYDENRTMPKPRRMSPFATRAHKMRLAFTEYD